MGTNPQMMVEIAGIVGLTIILIEVIKMKWKIPSPLLAMVALAIAIPLNLLNVYLPTVLPALAMFAIQGAVVAVFIAFGVFSMGKKMLSKEEEKARSNVPPFE